MKDVITVGIDKTTYSKLSRIAQKKQKTVPEEMSNLIQSHIDKEAEKEKELREGKQYLTEDN